MRPTYQMGAAKRKALADEASETRKPVKLAEADTRLTATVQNEAAAHDAGGGFAKISKLELSAWRYWSEPSEPESSEPPGATAAAGAACGGAMSLRASWSL